MKLFHLRRNVKFVIMNSVYYTDKYLQTFYDLKGSVTGRTARSGQDVKKDNDLRASLPDGAIALNPTTRERVRKQIVADCEFMTKMKIMDYSLLMGIHHISPTGRGLKKVKSVGTTGFRFSDARKESSKFRDLLRSSLTTTPGHSSLPNHAFSDEFEAVRSNSLPGNPTDSEDAAGLNKAPVRRPLQKGVSAPVLSSRERENFKDDSKDSDKQFAQLAMYEYGLDDDDDNSYLEGSRNNPIDNLKVSIGAMENLELKKEQTIEQVYWPFHRLHDIHGYRRMIPRRCPGCSSVDICTCDADTEAKLNVGAFVPPLSDRKDGGLMMDTSGYELPIKFKTGNGREHLCEGKIFYVGIIDILQQYNTRKRIEARYRRARGSGWHDASCMHPDLYAERFVRFFDEYSQHDHGAPLQLETKGEEKGEEDIAFSREETKQEIEPEDNAKVKEDR